MDEMESIVVLRRLSFFCVARSILSLAAGRGVRTARRVRDSHYDCLPLLISFLDFPLARFLPCGHSVNFSILVFDFRLVQVVPKGLLLRQTSCSSWFSG